MKFLLLLALIAGVFWWMSGRRRRADSAAPKPAPAEPVVMLACAHCGVNLPRTEALQDGAGRPYCSAAHVAAGPR